MLLEVEWNSSVYPSFFASLLLLRVLRWIVADRGAERVVASSSSFWKLSENKGLRRIYCSDLCSAITN